jgi:hypothetical protein
MLYLICLHPNESYIAAAIVAATFFVFTSLSKEKINERKRA